MIYNIAGFANDKSCKLQFTHNFEIPHGYHVLEKSVLIDVDGVLSLSEDIFSFSASLTGDLHCLCDLCLEQTIINLKCDFNEKFSEVSSDNDEIWLINDKTIDFTEAIYTCVLLNLPTKILCSSNCKGLCTTCGTNLNIAKCNCKATNIDPRWDALSSLLEEKEV